MLFYLIQLIFMAFRTLSQGEVMVFILLSYPHWLLFNYNLAILHPSCLSRNARLKLCEMVFAQYTIFLVVLCELGFELVSSYDYLGLQGFKISGSA